MARSRGKSPRSPRPRPAHTGAPKFRLGGIYYLTNSTAAFKAVRVLPSGDWELVRKGHGGVYAIDPNTLQKSQARTSPRPSETRGGGRCCEPVRFRQGGLYTTRVGGPALKAKKLLRNGRWQLMNQSGGTVTHDPALLLLY